MLLANLGDIENKMLEMFLSLNFSWKETLLQQIQESVVCSEYLGSSFFINFSVSPNKKLIAVSERVPIEILVDHAMDNTDVSVFYKREKIVFANDGNKSPTGFNLHIINGVISEIEAYSLAGDILDLKHICAGKRYCFILEG